MPVSGAAPRISALPDASAPEVDEYVLRLLDECRNEVQLADSKANMLFATVATVIAIMVGLLLDDASELRSSGSSVVVLATLALLSFMVSLVLLALAVTPRLGTPERGKARYFQEHAEFADSQALLDVLVVDAEHASVRHASQLHTLSRIVRRKYRHVRRAMQVISVSMGLVVAVALTSAMR